MTKIKSSVILTPEAWLVRLFTTVINTALTYANPFVTVSHFRLSLIFGSKGKSLPLKKSPISYNWLKNKRHGWEWLTATSPIRLITSVKKFYVGGQW